ncbi:hypothetical protein RFI_10679 [Reticulomyxa filosa]|uniref:Uncharacterized protein n=1 Tax=Reticulomyxa filosa TaxID=46433 RepID=X6NL80_RETFI|nr:hypothetical protein RFI_10679 [Reticulomyxa filosa]|eukprot:ETO26459.1 hypothetical protein RFI_10679 [Reticulomyxa filosa]
MKDPRCDLWQQNDWKLLKHLMELVPTSSGNSFFEETAKLKPPVVDATQILKESLYMEVFKLQSTILKSISATRSYPKDDARNWFPKLALKNYQLDEHSPLYVEWQRHCGAQLATIFCIDSSVEPRRPDVSPHRDEWYDGVMTLLDWPVSKRKFTYQQALYFLYAFASHPDIFFDYHHKIMPVLEKVLPSHWETIKSKNDVLGRLLVFDVIRVTSRWISTCHAVHEEYHLEKPEKYHKIRKLVGEWTHRAIRCLAETDVTIIGIFPHYLSKLLMASALRAAEELMNAWRGFDDLIEDKKVSANRPRQIWGNIMDQVVMHDKFVLQHSRDQSQITDSEINVKINYSRILWHMFFLNIVLKPRPCKSAEDWNKQHSQRQMTWVQHTALQNVHKLFLAHAFHDKRQCKLIPKKWSPLKNLQIQYCHLFVGFIERLRQHIDGEKKVLQLAEDLINKMKQQYESMLAIQNSREIHDKETEFAMNICMCVPSAINKPKKKKCVKEIASITHSARG